MEDHEVKELADIINWCDAKDREPSVKVCGNCKHLIDRVKCYEFDSSGQIVIVSEQSSCDRWSNK
jgi:hypothetical protein